MCSFSTQPIFERLSCGEKLSRAGPAQPYQFKLSWVRLHRDLQSAMEVTILMIIGTSHPQSPRRRMTQASHDIIVDQESALMKSIPPTTENSGNLDGSQYHDQRPFFRSARAQPLQISAHGLPISHLSFWLPFPPAGLAGLVHQY